MIVFKYVTLRRLKDWKSQETEKYVPWSSYELDNNDARDLSTKASGAPSSSLWSARSRALSPWWAPSSAPAAGPSGQYRGGASAPAAASPCCLSGRPQTPPECRTSRWASPAPLSGCRTACKDRPPHPTGAWSWTHEERGRKNHTNQ